MRSLYRALKLKAFLPAFGGVLETTLIVAYYFFELGVSAKSHFIKYKKYFCFNILASSTTLSSLDLHVQFCD